MRKATRIRYLCMPAAANQRGTDHKPRTAACLSDSRTVVLLMCAALAVAALHLQVELQILDRRLQ